MQFVPENGALVVPPADDAYIHRPAKTPEGQHVALALGYRPAASAVPTLSLEDCFWLYDATTAADVLYSEFGRVFYDADIAIARSRLGDVQFLQIM
ncbi:MAG: hypothetical protein QOI26_1809 [Pseudonocardiales bacterium]|nr:hypothetical protein [Pseudonocardiales bacterium]